MFASVALSAFGLSCGGAQSEVQAPSSPSAPIPVTPVANGDGGASAAAPTKEMPPGPGQSKESPFPKATHSPLSNGLDVAVIEAHALPIVQIRLLVRAGMGFGAAPGVAALTAQLLKDGGTKSMTSAELLRRVESLGASLSVATDFDSTVLGMAVTREHLSEALSLMGAVVQEPKFDSNEFKKLKVRERDQAEENARANGSWMATRIIYRELYPAASPYSVYSQLPSELAAVTEAHVKAFHKQFYTPKNATLILAGDVDSQAASKAAQSVFGKWVGGDAPKREFPAATLPSKRRVIIAHRAKSVQSDVYVVGLAPERHAAEWPAIRMANYIYGGGMSSWLFNDVREQRSLAYTVRSQIVELAHDEQPFVSYAGTQTPKTAQAVQGLLDNIEKLARGEVSEPELEGGRRYLSDIFAIRMETVGAIADLAVQQHTLGLPDGYWDTYRTKIRAMDKASVAAAATKLAHPDRSLVVVAGDSDAIAGSLARFGEVTIVDAENEFRTIKTLPFAEAAK